MCFQILIWSLVPFNEKKIQNQEENKQQKSPHFLMLLLFCYYFYKCQFLEADHLHYKIIHVIQWCIPSTTTTSTQNLEGLVKNNLEKKFWF